MQYGYADFVPSQSYYAFASALGCFGPPALPQGNSSASIFQCLVAQDTEALQNASAAISGSSRYGTWAFLPVTDDIFVQQLPSQQLLKKQVNGNRILVGVSSYSPMRCWLTNYRMMPMKVQRSLPRLSGPKTISLLFFMIHFPSSLKTIFLGSYYTTPQPMLPWI